MEGEREGGKIEREGEGKIRGKKGLVRGLRLRADMTASYYRRCLRR